MAKNSVADWDENANNNTDVGGINIDENCLAENLNNAIREVMAQIKTYSLAVIPPGSVNAYAGSTAPTGWLFLNADTIGSAASSATQKSDDYQTLFELLWNSMADAEAPVVGGRGASANDDWVANKAITLPDGTGRAIAGKEVVESRITAAVSGFSGATQGASGGLEQQTTQQTTQTASSQGGGNVRPDETHVHTVNVVQPTLILNWIIKW